MLQNWKRVMQEMQEMQEMTCFSGFDVKCRKCRFCRFVPQTVTNRPLTAAAGSKHLPHKPYDNHETIIGFAAAHQADAA